MIVPRFWARRDFTATDADGLPWTRSALGWSPTSQPEADQMAAARAERFARVAASGRWPGEADGVLYYDAVPSREPMLDALAIDGRTVAVVTRNRYGCRVLNAERVLFADVDLGPPWQARQRSVWRRIVERFKPSPVPPPAPVGSELERDALARVRDFHARTGEPVRVYRTFAGLRLMLVGRTFEPSAAATIELLKSLQSDPLYVSLTKRQDCFRARLTPKPWRIGVASAAWQSPINHSDYAKRLERWAADYEAKARAFATCRLIETLGEPADDPEIAAVLALHDRHVLAANDRPLA